MNMCHSYSRNQKNQELFPIPFAPWVRGLDVGLTSQMHQYWICNMEKRKGQEEKRILVAKSAKAAVSRPWEMLPESAPTLSVWAVAELLLSKCQDLILAVFSLCCFLLFLCIFSWFFQSPWTFYVIFNFHSTN